MDINYEDIDVELRKIIKLMNQIKGIETVECCVGHNKNHCFIWFIADSIDTINEFNFNVLSTNRTWHCELDTGDPHRDWTDLHFVLVSESIDLLSIVNDLDLYCKYIEEHYFS